MDPKFWQLRFRFVRFYVGDTVMIPDMYYQEYLSRSAEVLFWAEKEGCTHWEFIV